VQGNHAVVKTTLILERQLKALRRECTITIPNNDRRNEQVTRSRPPSLRPPYVREIRNEGRLIVHRQGLPNGQDLVDAEAIEKG
jgi:hypothetical protein